MMQKLYSKKQTYFSPKAPINHLAGGLANLARFFVMGLITIYQWTLSPDHGIISIYTVGKCKFRPTCSQYTKDKIQDLGIIKGISAGWHQIKKCH